MSTSSEAVWVPVSIIRETEMAVLVSDGDSDTGVWLPKSQIMDVTDDMNIGADIEIEIPVWLAEREGLI